MSDCVEANLNRKQRKENVEEVKEKSLSFWDLERNTRSWMLKKHFGMRKGERNGMWEYLKTRDVGNCKKDKENKVVVKLENLKEETTRRVWG